MYKKRKAGRPSYRPTEKERKMVESMAAYSIKQRDIALAMGLSPMTLRKHFATEIAVARIKANARVSETAFNLAISGKCPAATVFWLKCQAGWRETMQLEHMGEDGGPMQIESIERVIVYQQDGFLRAGAVRRASAFLSAAILRRSASMRLMERPGKPSLNSSLPTVSGPIGCLAPEDRARI
jgi:hypothetical protein